MHLDCFRRSATAMARTKYQSKKKSAKPTATKNAKKSPKKGVKKSAKKGAKGYVMVADDGSGLFAPGSRWDPNKDLCPVGEAPGKTRTRTTRSSVKAISTGVDNEGRTPSSAPADEEEVKVDEGVGDGVGGEALTAETEVTQEAKDGDIVEDDEEEADDDLEDNSEANTEDKAESKSEDARQKWVRYAWSMHPDVDDYFKLSNAGWEDRFKELQDECKNGESYIYPDGEFAEEDQLDGVEYCSPFIFMPCAMAEANAREDWDDWKEDTWYYILPAIVPEQAQQLHEIVHTGFALLSAWNASQMIPLKTNSAEVANAQDAFRTKFAEFKALIVGKLFSASTTSKHVKPKLMMTHCGSDAHPAVLGPIGKFPATIFEQVIDGLQKLSKEENFSQLEKPGLQFSLDDPEGQDNAPYVPDSDQEDAPGSSDSDGDEAVKEAVKATEKVTNNVKVNL